MHQKVRGKARRTEVLAGFIIILAAFSFMVALLIDFSFVSPYGTPGEDLSFLFEHTRNQLASAVAWLVTALIALLAMPFYLAVFHRKTSILSYLNAILVLGASAGFVMMGIAGFKLHLAMLEATANDDLINNEQTRIAILGIFRDQQFYRHIGSSFLGVFAFGLSLTRFKVRRFPFFAALLLFVSGPALVFFNWYDPEHVARTAAMAGMLVGILIFSSRLVNKGM